MEQSIRCGIDIAKLVFQIHGVNAKSGETVMVKKLARHDMLRFFANKPPSVGGFIAAKNSRCAKWRLVKRIRLSVLGPFRYLRTNSARQIFNMVRKNNPR